MLDLPHHRCNSVYVPWQSKGQRVTMTMRNNNGTSQFFPFLLGLVPRLNFVVIVRHHAMGPSDLRQTDHPLPSTAGTMARSTVNDIQFHTDTLPSSYPELRIDTQVGEDGCPKSNANILSPTQYDSPVSNVKCDGWCEYDLFERRIAVSFLYHFS